ncbi:MAG: hypothetical protein MUE62_02805 [Burkholderiaceae bacterium]|nr:hypothetical protein [Burkholderiaceae bacterium]
MTLLDPLQAGLLPEVIAARTPLVFRAEADTNPASHTVGWAPVYLGLRSSAAQWRAGQWSTREDWMLPELEAALAAMADQALPGYRVAVLQVWTVCSQLSTEVWVQTWPERRWRWARTGTAPFSAYEQPGRLYAYLRKSRLSTQRSSCDRRAWDVRMLDGPYP